MNNETKMTSGNEIVDRMLNFNLTDAGVGVCIPLTWYEAIKHEKDNEKAYHEACSILAEIAYWYRPKIEYDDNGEIISIKKRFSQDLLQKSYADLAKAHGITKGQAKNAVNHLEKLGIIKKDFQTIDTHGRKLPNVLYIKLNVDRLFEITYPKEVRPSNCNGNNGQIKNRGILREMSPSAHINTDIPNPNIGDAAFNRQTNTDNTTNKTKNNTSSPSEPVAEGTIRDVIANRIKLDELMSELPYNIGEIDSLLDIIYEVFESGQKSYRIKRQPIATDKVKEKYLKLDKNAIKYIIHVLDNKSDETPSPDYIRTVIYNAPEASKFYKDNKLATNTNGKKTSSTSNSIHNFSERANDLDEMYMHPRHLPLSAKKDDNLSES